jgi:hypothetical protein
MFWLLPLFMWMMFMRRRRWERWQAPPPRDPELEEQRSYIESLESRVLQLEERLDFTERLLASRHVREADPVTS